MACPKCGYNKYDEKNSYDDQQTYSNKPKKFLSPHLLTVDDTNSILYNTLPKELQCYIPVDDEMYYMECLDKSSSEYQDIVHNIEDHGDIDRIEITSIKRVTNPYISSLYELKKLEMKSVHGNKLKELRLYHGTDAENSNSICSENFNYRFCGTNRGTKYGEGVSFSPFFFYAKRFADTSGNGKKSIFVCDVLCTYSHIGDRYTDVPDEGYDTTTSAQKEVYVKYDDDTFLPRYKIVYYMN